MSAAERQSTRDRLVDAAMRLFYERGYTATGLAEVLKQAGVNSGSLYYFFKSKEELLLAVLDKYEVLLWPVVIDPAHARSADPVERIFHVLSGYREGLILTGCTGGCPIGNLALELADEKPEVRAKVAKLFDLWCDAVRQSLDAAADRLPPDVDRAQLARFVLTVMEGGVMQARAHSSVAPFDEAVAHLRDYFDWLLSTKGQRLRSAGIKPAATTSTTPKPKSTKTVTRKARSGRAVKSTKEGSMKRAGAGLLLLLLSSAAAHAQEKKNERVLRKEVTVTATLGQVWRAWTTEAGMAEFFAPKSKIELQPGGAYELYMGTEAPAGLRGSEGCKVLAYAPNSMLSFSWNAPPAIPEIRKIMPPQTYVVLLFDQLPGNRVKVTLTELGWGEGPEWDKAYVYFDRAWALVLNNLKKHFDEVAAPAPPDPNPLAPFARLVGSDWIAKNMRVTYEWGLGKRSIRSHSFITGGGKDQLTYESFYAWHPQKKAIVAHAYGGSGFEFEGTTMARADGLETVFVANGAEKVTNYRETFTYPDEDSYHWTLYRKDGDAWKQVIDATFRRVGKPVIPEGARTWTDGNVTVIAADAPAKSATFVMTVPASLEAVWRMLATSEGMRSVFPTLQPNFELKPGGTYEIFSGAGNKVMSFVPRAMLAVTGSAPPQFPNVRKGGTWGVYRFEPLGEKSTRVTLTTLGWRPGEKEWDEAFDYFLKNNPIFLNMLHKQVTGG